MTPFDYIREHVNVKIAPSRIHGVGVFALKDIKPGEKLFTEWRDNTGWYALNQQQLDFLNGNVREHLYDMFQFGKVDGVWKFNIYLEQDCHWIFKSPTHWINSCSYDSEPNIDIEKLVSITHIKAGEELLTKYGKYQKNENLRTI